ncbi:MAG: 16S rRNA (guanine(527)-N(7))-methyltransferase RsmG [Hydrogenophaga sp.]
MSRADLTAGLEQLGLALSEAQVTQLLDYLALLQKWNKVYNLTAVRDPAEMLTHHLLDSLAAIGPLVRQTEGGPGFGAGPSQGETAPGGSDPRSGGAWGTPIRLLDVGSGGGLPGVVIAIVCPHIAVSCVDTVGKKAAFIQQAAATLRLPNLRGVHARVETLKAEQGDGFDVVCSRAFASLVDFTAWSRAALNPDAVWMAMKAKHPAEELTALPADIDVFHVEQLQVPGLDAERCIIWMRPSAV